jgi:type I restriction enzyme S subunit
VSALVALGDICRPKQWKTLSKSEMSEAGFPVYGANGPIGYADRYTHEKPTILIGCRGSCGTVNITQPKSYANGNAMALDELDESRVDLQYIYRYLSHRGFRDVTTGTSQPQIIGSNLRRVQVPLPPLADQRRIAAILDKADVLCAKRQKSLRLAQTLAAAYFAQEFGDGLSGKASARLADLTSLVTKGTTPTTLGFEFVDSGIPFLRVQNLRSLSVSLEDALFISAETHEALQRSKVKPLDVLISIAGTIGRTALVPEGLPEMNCNQAVAIIRCGEKLDPVFLLHWLQTNSAQEQVRAGQVTGTISNISLGLLRGLEIDLPPIERQREFAAKVKRISVATRIHEVAMLRAESLFSSLQDEFFADRL